MDDEAQKQDLIALEIEKHRKDAEEAIMRILRKITQKDPSILTFEEKGFLKARQSYLTAGQREEYASVLKENYTGEPPLEELTREELDAKALALGIESPEALPNKKAVIEAIKAVKE